MAADIKRRKDDHLELCATDRVAFRERTTLLECVRLIHQSLPEARLDEVDLSTHLLGKRLRAPIVIAGMTGGTDRAAEINHGLAAIAERRGYGFGLGSQRAMQKNPDTAWTYEVRKHAPTTLLLGNVGIVQARDYQTEVVAGLLRDIGADAICLHMNPAMELVQQDGDRDFRGCIDAFSRYVRDLSVPVVAKETGNGVSRDVAKKLYAAGVRHVDVSGAGGTSWVGVETLRASDDRKRLGEAFWDWGIPTAASVVMVAEARMRVIATGGIKTGLDIARAIALGATAAGIARPCLQAFMDGGERGAEAFLVGVENELRAAALLSGARNMAELVAVPKIVTGELREWVAESSMS